MAYKTIKIVFKITLFLTILLPACDKTVKKPVVAVYDFHVQNSEITKFNASIFRAEIGQKLFDTKSYLLCKTKTRWHKLFKRNSKEKSANGDCLESVNYCVFGDIIENKYLIVKMVDVKQKKVFYSHVYDFSIDSMDELKDLVAKNIEEELREYHF